ncbi:flagellar filament capping protein FliD [Paracidovorax anthurii]|uniref:Flagellar hook-associated protein 2 n=1 Tax=Paracidovorax anthurii TaxID=78229 RepID=A0A328YS92_9BURK|nr:flagellar filament capping protein FliD [Paracidovorax anthurii]RAR76848.1 flagellar hook-associated protein 2 [Paracidovorax anthurii]
MANIDPAGQAQSLATAYTEPARQLLARKAQSAQTLSSAYTKLKSALSTFETALSGLSAKKGLTQNAATFSTTGYGTATASASAQPGTYQFFVEQTASAHQVAFSDLPAVPVALGGPLVVQLADGTNFTVNVGAADSNGDGTISQAEIARAINQANDNKGKVSATVVSSGGSTSLMLTAGSTGAGNAITVDASGLPDSALKTALSATPTTLTAARDAKIWLGAKDTGTLIEQASNTLTAISGVSITFTKAQAATETPLAVTVAADKDGTAANVQTFVDAYNALKKVLDEVTKTGNPEAGTSSAALSSDASVRTLRSRLGQMLRQEFGGQSLLDLGVSIDRTGTLTLDKAKLQTQLEANPEALGNVMGSASLSGPSGLMGALDTYLDGWTQSSTGQIARRQQSIQTQQKSITDRQARLTDQYNTMYQRYLKQYSQLQQLMTQMEQTSSNLF